VTLFQFAMSAVSGFLISSAFPKSYKSGWKLVGMKVLPLTLAQALGFLATNVSFGNVSVPLTHTVKASDPFFTLTLSVLLRGEKFPTSTYLSLIPIFVGVGLAAGNDITFNMFGFWAGAFSNICFSYRTICSKEVMQLIDNVNLYYFLSVTAFLVTLPLWCIVDGGRFIMDPSLIVNNKNGVGGLLTLLCICGICHYAYNQTSYLVLSEVTPLTHAVLNVLRRAFVIICSSVYFGNIPAPKACLGFAAVVVGVVCYAQSRAPKGVEKGPERRRK